jgi:DNA-binding IclR family transcriptional regulator
MVLELLAAHGRGLTFTEISTIMRLPKSSLHELLTILTDRHFVEWDPDGRRYALGIRTWECGQAYIGQRDLMDVIRPLMQSVGVAVNETVQLAILDGRDTVYLERVDSSHTLRLQTQVGSREPAHMTSLGKVMLADLRDSELLRLFEDQTLVPRTPHTLVTLTDLLESLRRIRALGFAIDNEEFSTGLRCVAVPIRGHSGSTIAAMSISVPLMRGSAHSLTAFASSLARVSTEASRRLGCPIALAANPFADDLVALERTIGALLQRDETHS